MNISPSLDPYRDEKQNQVHFAGDLQGFPKTLDLTGRRNRIEIGEGVDLRLLDIFVSGDDNLVYIGAGSLLRGEIHIRGHNQTVQIGDRTTFGHVQLFASESTNIRIGDDCMFATGIDIRTSDSHELICLASRLRVNPPGSVTIGRHVCIEKDVTIAKGVSIGANSLVTARSFVNQTFDQENVMISGTPARIVRENVHWERPRFRLE